MKILLITNAGGSGGASVAWWNIVSQLKDKVEFTIVFPNKGFYSDLAEKAGFKCIYLRYYLNVFPSRPSLGRLLNPLWMLHVILILLRNNIAYHKLLSYVQNSKIDIIHTNVGPVDLGYRICKKTRISHLWHIRESLDVDFDMHPFWGLNKQIKLYQSAETIVITKHIADHFSIPLKNVIYDGVIDECPTSGQDNENYFLFVGRIEDAKGIISLLEVFGRYASHNKKYDLWIAGLGTDDYMRKCKLIVEKFNIKERVKFLGYRADAYSLMSHAVALFVPSKHEGFGFITTEAMYNHCLVVGRDTGGTKEQFDNGVELTGDEIGIRYTDDEKLIQIMESIDSIEKQGLLDRAYKTVTTLYTKKQYADFVYKRYINLVK